MPVLTPADETDLAEAIRGAEGPFRIEGGGTRPLGNPVEGEVLSVAGITGTELYEPGALTIVVRAGTPLVQVEAVLAAEGQRLPFEPMDHRKLCGTEGTPTIGGVVAANVSGPRRVQAGACRDSLIGLRFVDGAGTVIRNGGRVMKNVTGYDLVKLVAGSYGTLGVLTEVAFKVLPAPETCGVLLINGLGVPRAVEAMSAALTSPFEVSGAAHTVKGVDGAPVTMIRIEGFETSVTYRLGRLKNLLAPFGEIAVERSPERAAAGWAWVRDVGAFAGRAGDVWRISVKPSDAPAVIERLGAVEVLLDWGGGLIWALMADGTDVRAAIAGIGGHATLVRASDATRRALGAFHPEAGPIAALSEGLRRKFDPRGILNPGLMAARAGAVA